MTNELTGTTAIVTGATGGMGRAITARLAAAGADVIATDLSDAGADDLMAAAPGSVHFVTADVSVADDIAAVVGAAMSRTGRLDSAVNAAAIEFETVPLHECSDDDFERMMRVNVRGVFLAMKHEIAAMLEGGRPGSIVNIASTNSFRPQHAPARVHGEQARRCSA